MASDFDPSTSDFGDAVAGDFIHDFGSVATVASSAASDFGTAVDSAASDFGTAGTDFLHNFGAPVQGVSLGASAGNSNSILKAVSTATGVSSLISGGAAIPAASSLLLYAGIGVAGLAVLLLLAKR